MAVGTGSNAAIMGYGVLAASAIGIGVVLVVPPNRPAQPVAAGSEPAALVTEVAEAPEVSEVVADADQVADAPTPAVIMPPTREEFLMFPDGFATLAGKSTPGTTVDVMLDGVVLESVVADAQGNFGATLFIEPSDQPRVMRLIADPQGEAVASPETYFVQPTLAVAQADDMIAEPETGDGTIAQAAVADVTANAVDSTQEIAEIAPEALANDTDVAQDVEIVQAEPTVDDTAQASDIVALADTNPVAEVASDLLVEAEESEQPIAEAGIAETIDQSPQETAAPELTVSDAIETGVEPETGEQVVAAQVDAAPAEIATAESDTAEVMTPATQDSVAAVDQTVSVSETAQVVETEAEVNEPAAAAPASPAVLVADADGVRVLQPAVSDQSPEVMSNVALDTITYDDAGEVLIAGRASGEGFVQVYLDNKPITTTLISEQGDWRTDLPDVDTGVYTLRIDEVSAAGDVLSRIETPFQREEAETVAAVFAEETAEESFEVAVRTVQPGATLWAIAREQFGSGVMYVEVFEANRDLIRDPDLIYPGQVFRIPEVEQ